jgi:hypothetical protein
MKVEMGKKYTCAGKAIRILCIDGYDSLYPVIGMRDDGFIIKFSEDGKCTPEYNLVEAWEPKKDEWCLFWDDEKSDHFVLAKFLQITETGNFCSYRHGIWKHCSKFTGEFPEHLKRLQTCPQH